ncbi:MAG: hypothetical protein GX089_01140 [Fibrobacter sp.]|jgi:hypothetical protein|nr:hypothetical protein [Fibrobacter sp.]
MFDKKDPGNIWVSPGFIDGNGTWEKPYSTIKQALDRVKPGNTIILREGIYSGDLTIQVSGSASAPIRILPYEKGTVEIHESCWFFYDTSDLIISGLTFKNSPSGAISVIGKCRRNRFDSLTFICCGSADRSSCTLFFGGSGGEFNIVEGCVFNRREIKRLKPITPENTSIGLMISEGDCDGSKLRNHVLRRNHIINYDHGILVGSSDSSNNLYGHIVENNTIEECGSGAIAVKCGDTQVKGNLVFNCKSKSISLRAGTGSVVENNRIIDCGSGITVNGSGHTVANNCIVRCGEEAVKVCATDGKSIAASNILIEHNTFVDCGSKETKSKPRIAGITIEPSTTCAVQRNLIHGQGEALHIVKSVCYIEDLQKKEISTPAQYVVQDNAASGNCKTSDGFTVVEADFASPEAGNFENTTSYGASGWVTESEIPAESDDYFLDYETGFNVQEDENGELIFPQQELDLSFFGNFEDSQTPEK